MTIENRQTIEKLDNILILNPQNFTPLTRTPWAGFELSKTIKREIVKTNQTAIGESWEVSCDLEFPSSLLGLEDDLTLDSLIKANPESCLSADFIKENGASFDILIKLVNARKPLSLQIHPPDLHPSLSVYESGKPESWLILGSDEGAGVYIGFRPDITKDELAYKLKSGLFQKDDLYFVPCKPGDFFEIRPGVPHALGAGIMIFEPQRVHAGRKGVTWRMWDWNRSYNSIGAEDPDGTPRSLNIEEGLELLEGPNILSGAVLLKNAKKSPETLVLNNGTSVSYFPANSWYQVTSIQMNLDETIMIDPVFLHGAITCVDGELSSKRAASKPVVLTKGYSGFIPHSALPLEFRANRSNTHIIMVRALTTTSTNKPFVTLR